MLASVPLEYSKLAWEVSHTIELNDKVAIVCVFFLQQQTNSNLNVQLYISFVTSNVSVTMTRINNLSRPILWEDDLIYGWFKWSIRVIHIIFSLYLICTQKKFHLSASVLWIFPMVALRCNAIDTHATQICLHS